MANETQTDCKMCVGTGSVEVANEWVDENGMIWTRDPKGYCVLECPRCVGTGRVKMEVPCDGE